MDNFVTFFQILCGCKAPLCKQCKCEAKEKLSTKKRNSAHMQEASGQNDQPLKQAQQENFCCPCITDGYEVLVSSCNHHSWSHPDYRKPTGSTSYCSHDQQHVDDMNTADMIVITPVPQVTLAISKTIKTGIISLLLETAMIRITMQRNMDNHNLAHIFKVETMTFKGIPMKHPLTIHILPITTTMCHHFITVG